jgi:hypothetical protein
MPKYNERKIGDYYTLPPSLLLKMKIRAKLLGISKAQFTRKAIEHYLAICTGVQAWKERQHETRDHR